MRAHSKRSRRAGQGQGTWRNQVHHSTNTLLSGSQPQEILYNYSWLSLRIRFLTSTPLDIKRGSGTYAGIHALAQALEKLGHTIAYETPRRHFANYTLERLVFNHSLRRSDEF